jgi:hypothetical protein
MTKRRASVSPGCHHRSSRLSRHLKKRAAVQRRAATDRTRSDRARVTLAQARTSTLDADTTHGGNREPLLKLLHFLRAMEYSPKDGREVCRARGGSSL